MCIVLYQPMQGAGNVGSVLGGALLKSDSSFSVHYGVRDASAEKYKKLFKKQPMAHISTVHDAVNWGEVIILAVPGSYEDAEIKKVVESLGSGVEGKILIDVTNPLSPYPALETRIWTHNGISAGEAFAAALPKSTYVYKAFNTIGAEHMDRAADFLPGQRLTILFAGPDNKVKKEVVEDVIAGVGFEPAYVGPIRYARNLEAMAELWIHLGLDAAGETKEQWGRNFHFQVVRK
jgi:predicted dinucleotide-binding enzyme